ncbi:hypothetical protein OF83DRAFT_1070739 [Amylostereum chailletii]|nr:hypothetical protein OF83DRAFT_1070739 [Amylostereum chailletii]
MSVDRPQDSQGLPTPANLNQQATTISQALYTPRKQAVAQETVTHLQQTDAAFVTRPDAEVNSSCRIPAPLFVQVPPTPDKVRNLLEHPLPYDASMNEVIKERDALWDELDTMRTHLDASRRIIEGHNATMALQDMALKKLTQKLYWKEKRKSQMNELLNKKVGRYLTSDGFAGAIQKGQAARRLRLTERVVRAHNRQLNKGKVQWRKKATERKKKQRAIDLRRWEMEKERCRKEGLRLPPKPKAPAREPTPDRFKTDKDNSPSVPGNCDSDVDGGSFRQWRSCS